MCIMEIIRHFNALLDLGKGFGNHGHRPNVASLCGLSRTISAGRLISYHVGGYLIRSIVLFVTKKRRLSTISLSIVSSWKNFGSIVCSDRLVFRLYLLSLLNYPSMLGGRKLAAAPLMNWRGKELIRSLYSELGLYGTITMGVFLMEQLQT